MSNIGEALKEIDRWQRQYKTAQRRGADTLKTYSTNLHVTIQPMSSVRILTRGNAETMLGAVYVLSADGDNFGFLSILPVYENGACGWRLYNYNYVGRVLDFDIQVVTNQKGGAYVG